MNQINIMGRIVRDAAVGYTKNGKAYAKFTVVTNDEYYQNGEKKETSSFINCVAWGKLGEACQSLLKGKQVIVAGRMQSGSYEVEGVKKYTMDLIATFVGTSILESGALPADDADSAFASFGGGDLEEVPF